MTNEEKQLLLKDLCARLVYRVKCKYLDDTKVLSGIYDDHSVLFEDYDDATIDDIKPYLRPMSSMVEEEKEELTRLCPFFEVKDENWIRHGIAIVDEIDGTWFPLVVDPLALDWLNAHHFDYRGLIEKGLALEAPEGMYED